MGLTNGLTSLIGLIGGIISIIGSLISLIGGLIGLIGGLISGLISLVGGFIGLIGGFIGLISGIIILSHGLISGLEAAQTCNFWQSFTYLYILGPILNVLYIEPFCVVFCMFFFTKIIMQNRNQPYTAL